jgi:hypothetical protein
MKKLNEMRKTGSLIFVDGNGNLRKRSSNAITLVKGVKGFRYGSYKHHLFVYETIGMKKE